MRRRRPRQGRGLIVAELELRVRVVKTESDLWLELPEGSDRWALVARRSSLGVETKLSSAHPWAVLASVEDYSPLDLDRTWNSLWHGPRR